MPHRLILLLSLTLVVSAVYGQDTPETLDARPVYVALFKNGLGLVVVRAEVPEAGTYQIAPLPQAMLGSLWLTWTPGLMLGDVTSAFAAQTRAVQAASVADILRANIGRSVSLQLQGEEIWRQVVIVSMPDVPKDPPSTLGHPGYPVPPQRGDLLVLREDNRLVAIPPGRVMAVRASESDLQDTYEQTTNEPVIRFTAADGQGRGRSVEMSYVAQGMAWAPSYVVEIDAEDRARLSAKAVVVNDLIDLDETRVELIAGYPNLPFADAVTALSLEPLAQILNRISATRGSSFRDDALFRQRVALDEVAMPGGVAGPTMPGTPVGGEATEDLYFYELPAVTLRRGERSYVPLFAAAVPYTDLYTWDLPDFVDANDRYQVEIDAMPQVVWHAIKLTNSTEQPWTTAPAMTLKDGRVLGQSTLPFTPPAGTSRLPITQAVSIKAEQGEFEIERRRDATRFHSNSYDEVVIEGTLTLTNFKSEAVTVEVTKTLSGEVTSTDGAPEVVRLAQGMRRVNPRSRLTWTVTVPADPQQVRTLKYQYRFYTR